MSRLSELQDFLTGKDIKFFTAKELIKGRFRGNIAPPGILWNNIIPVLKVLDDCRNIFGRLKINSGYRSPEYNAKVGGAKFSQHKLFKACDIQPLDADIETVCKWLNSRIPADSWGLRLYENFIHIDCRRNYYRDIEI